MNFLRANNQDTVIFGYSPNSEMRFLSRGFLPTDLPNLQVWLDANEGILNAIGVPSESVSVVVNIEEVYSEDIDDYKNPNGIYEKIGASGGKNSYQNSLLDDLVWENDRWKIYVRFEDEFGGEYYTVVESEPQGNIDYPWEASWSSGGIIRASPENDIAATNNQTVEQWNNKAPGKPNLQQTLIPSLRPIFASSTFGRKNVLFSGSTLHNSNFSNFAQEYSYYFVSTSLISSAGSAIKLTTDLTRGSFGSNATSLIVRNVNQTATTNLSRNISGNFGVFSARFNLSAGQVTVGRNLNNEVVNLSDTTSANTSAIVIGGDRANVMSSSISSRFSEILVYNSFHDNNTAQEIVNYLVQKWNINTNL